MLKRLKAGMANAMLVVVTLVITYAIGEVVFFRFALPHLSLTLRTFLAEKPDFFLQNSKDHYIPQDYIALVGDSYAAGLGDWLLSTGDKKDKPFHSANVIHDVLKRDVATFGRAAAGSAEAMVQRIARLMADDTCYLFPSIPEPSRFLVYVYEGNDIDDNIFLLQWDVKPTRPDIGPELDAFLENTYAAPVRWRCHAAFGDFIFKLARYAIKYAWRNPGVIDRKGNVNEITIAGRTIGTPELNVPSLGLSDAQVDTAVTVYEHSLAWFRRRFPDIPTTVVYIPSPSVVYRFPSGEVSADMVYFPDAPGGPNDRYKSFIKYPAAQAYAASQKICEKMRAVTLKAGAGFIDARPTLRKRAAETTIHGPRDWGHLNEQGYRALGTMLAKRIDEKPADACDDTWPQ